MASDEQLLEDLRAFAEELGRTPTKREMTQDGTWSAATYQNYFGSWNKALKKAGLSVNRSASEQQLLEDLRDFADELGRTPTHSEMNKDGPWSADTYQNYFGSWNKALKKAGLSVNQSASEQQLLEDLRDFADELGRTPTEREMTQDGTWSADTYQNYFGSWNEALKKAGFGVNHELNISKQQLLEDLRAFADELGHAPTKRGMNQNGPWSAKPYENHFGSWNEALKEANLDVNCPSHGNGEESYGRGWAVMRRATLERDDNQCRVCGWDDGTPHAHHIEPRREFDDVSDSNTLDNLIALCPSCHSRFEGWWTDADPDEFAERAKEFYVSTA